MKNSQLESLLFNKIEILREQMHCLNANAAAAKIINGPKTRIISQKLDVLILEAMRCLN